jgi:hypothetical protein
MEWLATAIRTYKGQASVVQVQGFDDLPAEQLKRLFLEARSRDYQKLLHAAVIWSRVLRERRRQHSEYSLPVYLVVVLLAPSYKRWAKNRQLNAFVRGVTAAATGAIAGAVIVLARRSVYDLPTILICAVSLAVLFRWKVPEPVLIACAAIAGLVLRHS